jgi:hypothetical protein
MATRITEPAMDQMMGNGWPSMLIANSIGKPSCRASQ